MAKTTVVIEVPEFTANTSFFTPFWQILAQLKSPYENKIKELLVNAARHEPRPSGEHYQNQTGQLRKATKAEGRLDTEIRLYVDQTQVDYAKYIIEPKYFNDPFIDEAIELKRPEITALIVELWTKAITEFNNLP